ncbi:MAG: hypothetical protein ACM3O7_03365 [Acidobacteriota bacterium]
MDDAQPRSVDWQAVAWWYVLLVSLHTFAVGAGLFFVPDWALRFGGWQVIPQPFFPRQAGIFHFILGIGYLAEYRRLRSFFLMVTAKTFAVVFLLGAAVFGGAPWFVPISGIGDGLMALGAVLIARRLHSRATA